VGGAGVILPYIDFMQNQRYAWYVTLVLMLCYTLSFLDRQILSLLVPQIKADLQLSDTWIGVLQGIPFAIFYALMGLPLGRVADFTNRRNLIAVCIAVWSVFTTSCAGARSFATLFLARMGVGIGEAGLNPSAFSILSDYFSKERLSAALSIFFIGNLLGSSMALIIGGTAVQAVTRQPQVTLPVLGTVASWRLTFLILGLPGLLFALLVLTVKEPSRTSLAQAAAGTDRLSLAETFRELGCRWQSVAGISLGFVFQAACNYGFSAWVPVYFQRVHGWSIGATGRALGSVILPWGCIGLYFGGWLSGHWQRRGVVDGPVRVAIPSAIGIILFLVPAMLMPSATWSLVLIGLGFFFLVLPMGTSSAALQLIFPNRMRAQVGALYLFILNLGGYSMGALMPGIFTDYLFGNPMKVGASIALTMTLGGIFMLVILSLSLRPYRRDYNHMHAATDFTDFTERSCPD
jgi:MFS family permease